MSEFMQSSESLEAQDAGTEMSGTEMSGTEMSGTVVGHDSGMADPLTDEMPGGSGSDDGGMPPGDGSVMSVGGTGATDSGGDSGTNLGGGGTSGGDSASDGEDRPRRHCATMEVHWRHLIDSEAYGLARAAIENEAAVAAIGQRDVSRSTVVTIPVVVHVIHKTASQNISDAQIRSQIRVLNEDFRALNADISTVPTVFEGLVADSKIEFALATVDPSGDPHSGIIRKETTVDAFGSDDKMKFDATGGSDAWPAAKYLNIWVCRLDRLLGYAQFPGGDAETDGVVVLDTAFGTTGTATAPFDRGRTATHEVGHWLNLFHIWGDDGTGCSGSDQVADTPNQGGPNYGKPTFPKVSCNNGPNGDLFVNYMDYVDDAAMVMFTEGQVNRMDATLAGPRSTLGAAAGSSPSGPVVSWGPSRLDAFVVGTDSGLYHKWWNGSSWGPSVTGYESMGGRIRGNPEVVAWGPNRLDAFVVGTDSGLYHKWWNGSSWGPSVTGYESMGGRIRGNPKVASWGPNRLDVFAVGMNSSLYHKWWNGSSWGPSVTGYEFMGGRIQGDPEVVAWGPDRLDVFVKGMNSGLYHKWWNGSSWGPSVTGYEFMGGKILGNPKAVSWGSDRLDVFVVGLDSRLYHKWWNGSSWGPSVTGYESLGGRIQGDPEVVAWGPNRLDVFVVGTDSRLYHKWWDGSSWGPSVTEWEDMGGGIIGQPHVVSWGPNRLDVFVVGTDSRLYHKWWNGSSWGPSVTGYEDMGGTIVNF